MAADVTQVYVGQAAAQPSDPNMTTGGSPDLWASERPLVATQAMDINTDSCCSRITDPGLVLGIMPDPDVTMATVSIVDVPSGDVALKHQHVSRWQSKLQAPTLPSMTTTSMNINIDPVCSRTTGPDLVPGSSSGPEDTMALGGSSGFPGLYDP